MPKKDLVQTYKERVKDAERRLGEWRREALESYEYVAGHQLSDDEKALLAEESRPEIVFNRTEPIISSVTGHQINNQHQVKYLPRREGTAKHNEIYSEAARWVDDESDSLDEISTAFWDMLVCGMGFTETRMDYDEDPEGKIYGAERVPPLEMGWDVSARKTNLADARFVYRFKWWDRDDAEVRWPEIKDIEAKGDDIITEDLYSEPEHDASMAWLYENDTSEWYDEQRNQVKIIQYQYWELETVYLVGDPQKRQLIEMDEERFKKIEKRLNGLGIRWVRQLRKKYRQAFFLGEHILEDGECPCPHSFTLRAMTGKRDEKKKYFYGLVRPMKDPQSWSNKFFSEIENIMTSNRTGGAFVEESALIDPRKAEEEWNDPNPLIMVADGAISKGAIMERQPIHYPTGIDRMMDVALTAIPQVTGINPELLGLTGRDQPGILEQTRRRAGMTILASLFNSLRRYNKERGRVLLYFITEYITDGRLIRITTEGGEEQYVPLTRQDEDDFVKYDVVVADAPHSPNQKEETFMALAQIMPMVIQMGVPVPPEVLDFLPVPQDLITKWKQLLQQRTQMSPEQRARIQAELRETNAKAYKDETAAVLNQVKAMVEQVSAELDAKLEPFKAFMEQLNNTNKSQ